MDRYKPKQEKSPIKAIREHCIECIGGRDNQGYKKLISECPSSDCGLYAFRFGKNPYHNQKLSNEQRKTLSDRARNSWLIRRAVGKSHPNLDDINAVDT
jgi:hypothetical protein